jgi:hypothetical protein
MGFLKPHRVNTCFILKKTKIMINSKISLVALLICGSFMANAQSNTIITAVPFLDLSSAANSTIAAIDVVGTSYNTQGSAETNPARMFQNKANISAAYTPWLRSSGLKDINLTNLNGHFVLNDRHAIGFHAKYFSLGQIEFKDGNGNSLGSENPEEFYTGIAYAFKASEHFSLGLNANYIYSRLANGIFNGINISPAQAFSVGIGGLYQNNFDVNLYKIDWSVGVAVTNIGSKISYTDDAFGEYIPTNTAIGGMIGVKELLPHFDLHLLYQMNKLLVPTPDTIDFNNNKTLDYKEKTLVDAMFGSFSDAAGGAKEEWQEISHSIGLEGMYHFSDKLQAGLRAGYFYESPTKGARQYFQLGGTVNYSGFYANVTWIKGIKTNQILDNTVSLNLGYALAI